MSAIYDCIEKRNHHQTYSLCFKGFFFQSSFKFFTLRRLLSAVKLDLLVYLICSVCTK